MSARPPPGATITLSPATASPTGTITVTGDTGFQSGETVDIFVDSTDVEYATANGSGQFPATVVHVPTPAIPGTHWITAIGRTSHASGQASFTVRTDWAQAGLDAGHNSWNIAENLISATNVSSLGQSWTGGTGAQSPLDSSPTVSGGTMYVGSYDGKVYAFDANGCGGSTCAASWTGTTGAPIKGTVAVDNGVAYVASTDNSLYAFDANGCGAPTCSPLWKATTGASIPSSPVVFRGLVYVGSTDGSLYAFREGRTCANPCIPAWSANTGSPIRHSPTVGSVKTLNKNVVFVGSDDGVVRAYDAANGGSPIWTAATGGAISSTPVFAANVVKDQELVYVGSADGKLYALVSSSGIVSWTSTFGASGDSSPTVAGSRVYAASNDGLLYAFNAAGCRTLGGACAPLWSAGSRHLAPSGAPPSVADGLVYVGHADGTLAAFRAAGCQASSCPTPLWTASAGAVVRTAVTIVNGVVYASAGNQAVHVYRLPSYPQPPAKPNPSNLHPFASPIRHVVIIFQENHSFDNVLGKFCADVAGGTISHAPCDGATQGKLKTGPIIPLTQAPDVVPLVGHNVKAATTAIDGGKMDGFSQVGGCKQVDNYACYSQYWPSQIPNLTNAAQKFVVADRTFESDPSASFGEHIDLASTQLDGFTGDIPAPVPGIPAGPGWGCDSLNITDWRASPGGPVQQVPSCIPASDGSGPYKPSPVQTAPTLMDRLDAAGLSWHVYEGEHLWSNQNVWSMCPTFAGCLYGSQAANIAPDRQMIADANAGTLPNVSWVVPFPGTGPHGSTSQHNGTSMTFGDNQIGADLNALMNGPEWKSTAIFIAYDDCGCFYDHVPPRSGLGIRTPMVIVSPYAKPSYTDSNVASFASMLAYIEHNFGNVPALSSRDQNAYDYAQSFNYSQTPLAPMTTTTRSVPRREIRYLRAHPMNPNAFT